ncbi:Uncharacterized protein dnl_05080 [Desulfonema limicola]|uniref:Uncharacterized protein n=1 Tax=Desulfonema limicola TaxID=45656 RepID=A0A975B3V5_9BACT|nr:hypothetical protein [Desulfonema limicola]QTA78288.1 Uncharacterized protein dnl_05080 [Desulfonema limicola]
MEIELTPEKIIEYGKKWQNIVLSGLEPDEIMARFSQGVRFFLLKQIF